MFHKHAVPPPFLPLPLCTPRIRSFVACPPGGILPRPTKRRKYTCLSFLCARYSFWWAGRAGGGVCRHDLCDCFRSPSLGLNYENGIVTFHSPSRSPSRRSRGERSERHRPGAGGPRGGRREELLSTAYYSSLSLSLSVFESATRPRALQSHRGSGHSFHLPCCSPVEFIALLDSKRMRIEKHKRTKQYLDRGKTVPT